MRRRWNRAELHRVDAIAAVLRRLDETGSAWVVRGSVAIACSTGPVARVPNDLDLFGIDGTKSTASALSDLGGRTVDGWEVHVEDVRPLRSSAVLPPGAARATITVSQLNDTIDRFAVDVTPRPVIGLLARQVGKADLGSRLDFTAQCMTAEGMFVEKAIACIDDATRAHSLRWADLYDLLALASSSSFRAGTLREALQESAAARRVSLPETLDAMPEWWAKPWWKTLWPDSRWADFETALKCANDVWLPLNSGVDDNSVWEPKRWRWLE